MLLALVKGVGDVCGVLGGCISEVGDGVVSDGVGDVGNVVVGEGVGDGGEDGGVVGDGDGGVVGDDIGGVGVVGDGVGDGVGKLSRRRGRRWCGAAPEARGEGV